MSGWLTFSQAIDPVLQAFGSSGWASKLTGIGLGITGATFLLELGSVLLDYWVQGGAQGAIGRFFRLLMITAIPVAMLTNWQAPASGSATSLNYDVVNFFFQDVPNALGLPANGSMTSSTGIDGAVQNVTKAWGDMASLLWDGPPPATSSDASAGSTGGAPSGPVTCSSPGLTQAQSVNCGLDGQTSPNAPAVTSSTGLLGSLLSVLENLASEIWLVVISFYSVIALSLCMFILTLALIFSLYGPLFMLNIGMIFGPVLVAFLPWRPTQNMFMRWVGYMLTMGAAYVIGLLLAKLGAIALTNFSSNIIANYQAAGTGVAAKLAAANTIASGTFPMMVSMIFLAMMMLRGEHIAAALFGGAAIGGGGAFAAMVGASALRSSPNKMIKGGAGGIKQGVNNLLGRDGAGKSGGAGGKGGVPMPAAAPMKASTKGALASVSKGMSQLSLGKGGPASPAGAGRSYSVGASAGRSAGSAARGLAGGAAAAGRAFRSKKN